MTTKRPTFVEITYADAMMRHHIKRGLKLVEKGGLKKEAQHELRQAVRWEKEKARLEKLRARGAASPRPARKKLPRRKVPS